MDGFSIERYEEKRESFSLFAAKFESGAMRFSGGNRSGAGALSKQGFLSCRSIIRNIIRSSSKLLKKPLLRQKDDKIPQLRQFNVYLILIYREY